MTARRVIPRVFDWTGPFRELADHGEKVGVKVTIENHWGLAADPMKVLAAL